jgi:acetyl esterase/lipase
VGVAGDSAGGLIAASVCHTIKKLDFQVKIP